MYPIIYIYIWLWPALSFLMCIFEPYYIYNTHSAANVYLRFRPPTPCSATMPWQAEPTPSAGRALARRTWEAVCKTGALKL